MTLNRPKYPMTALSAKQEAAALLLATGEFTQEAVADQIGVTRLSIIRWLKDPEFLSLVVQEKTHRLALLRRDGIRGKEYRIQSYVDDFERTERLIEARAVEYKDAPGGDTGLIVKQTKTIGAGRTLTTIDEYVLDAALLAERRALRRQIAQELGDWTEKAEIKGQVRREYIIRVVTEDDEPPLLTETPAFLPTSDPESVFFEDLLPVSEGDAVPPLSDSL